MAVEEGSLLRMPLEAGLDNEANSHLRRTAGWLRLLGVLLRQVMYEASHYCSHCRLPEQHCSLSLIAVYLVVLDQLQLIQDL